MRVSIFNIIITHGRKTPFLQSIAIVALSLKSISVIVRIVPVVSKNVQTIGTITWKRYPDDRKRAGSLQNLHDHPDRPDRTQFYPSDRDRLSRPSRLRSSG